MIHVCLMCNRFKSVGRPISNEKEAIKNYLIKCSVCIYHKYLNIEITRIP